MHYRYGDSSTSPFTSNFLEFLRDSLDFSVYVLGADQRIRGTERRKDDLQRRTDVELNQLDGLKRATLAAIESTPKGAPDSPAAECATRMASACEDSVRSAGAVVREKLAQEISQADAEEGTEREGCVKALLTLLAAHTPPEVSSGLRLRSRDTGAYQANVEGEWPGVGLIWVAELAIPDGHDFRQLLRVENLQRDLEISAPDQTGWLKKEVKMRPQRLERHVISEARVDGPTMLLRLRTEPGGEVGFDFDWDADAQSLTASRLVAGQDAVVAGPFDIEDGDKPKIIELCKAVRERLTTLKHKRLKQARLGDADFGQLSRFVDTAERLVKYLAPFVHEIAKHSLEPDELVLRKQLADDRREEIFVSKTTLRQKYEQLPQDLRALFAPLGLEAKHSRSMPPQAQPAPTTRAELPPSNPPPPPAKPIVPLGIRPLSNPTIELTTDADDRTTLVQDKTGR
jgi:hypothetical protein